MLLVPNVRHEYISWKVRKLKKVSIARERVWEDNRKESSSIKVVPPGKMGMRKVLIWEVRVR